MARVEVDEKHLELLAIAWSQTIDCGVCPLSECHAARISECRKRVIAWLTEKPIGDGIEDDGK